ncbi:hypothetical protein [Tenacibaculum singaporense]|uniref:Outer membrane protein beta-barrel domain-containing protein n=1 Tax=Tenacibaculum singaporense TaxID=2358479 RepID=A0A3S8R4R6_9FLAO|nr:hypothetical protein [Tenacibaculum singaporense]AZJ34795.1 hypothetical protein D6T69_04360 [Tenacibaculum singaporense]
MKTKILITLVVFLCIKTFAQEEIKGNYRIYLKNDGTSKNDKVPIVLEEGEDKEEVLYTINGKNATKKSKGYVDIDKNFSFKKINPKFNYSSIFVDLEQKENKLIILPREDVADDFKKYNGTKERRLYIDVTEGVKITRKSWKVSAITVPLKIYLTSQSDSLSSFTNNIETDVNVAVTYGKSWEKYSYKKGREPKLTNTQNFYGFLGLNKLELTEKNTDGINDGDNILSISSGVGYQYGYGKLGLSILLGMDFPVSSLGQNWVFKYQPWLGMGIGYSIFK